MAEWMNEGIEGRGWWFGSVLGTRTGEVQSRVTRWAIPLSDVDRWLYISFLAYEL